MVFEVMGYNLLHLVKQYQYKGIPLDMVRTIAKDILIGLNFIHKEKQIIHTDLKPENVLLVEPPEQIKNIMSK